VFNRHRNSFGGGVEVELIAFAVIAVEKDDGFGGGIVDSDSFCSLNISMFTSLISNLSFRTRVRR